MRYKANRGRRPRVRGRGRGFNGITWRFRWFIWNEYVNGWW